MHYTHRIVKAGVLFTAIAASTPAFAEQVGRVLFTSGEVRIVAVDGSTRLAKRGDSVQSGERIQTAAGALGQVQMNDGARVAVRSDSRLRFDVPPANAKAAQMSLESGNVRVLNIAAKGEAAIPPVEIKTADGNVLMQRADAVVANVSDNNGAGGEQGLIVRVDQGTGQVMTTGGTGAKTTALTTSNAVAINAGKVEPFSGDLGGNNALIASSSARLRSSDKTIASVTPLKPPTVSSLRPALGRIPGSVPSLTQTAIVTMSRSPLRPVSPLVPSTQLGNISDRSAPAIATRNNVAGQPTDLTPAVSALGSIVSGTTLSPASIRQPGAAAGQRPSPSTVPTATVIGGRTTITSPTLIRR